jgi:hypothetical protein
MGAVKVLQELFPQPGRLQFIYADLGDQKSVSSFMPLALPVCCSFIYGVITSKVLLST